MLRCTLCILLLRLALTSDVTLKEKELKVLRESVEAASIVRVRGEYNINGTCSWPDCAPVCEACDNKAMGTCMIPGVNECPWSSKCTMGTCFCSKGYCGVDSTCKFRTCTLGAQPPPYVAGNLAQEFASLGGEIPPYNAEKEEWVVFMNGCVKLPMFVLCIGMSIAILTCVCICCQLECECNWFPTAPEVLLSLCGVTVAVIVLGIVTRGIVVNENMNMIEEQLRRVDKTLDGSVDLAHKLIDMCMDFKAVVDDLPNTCNGMVPGAKEVMAMASEKANEKLTEMNEKVDAFARVAHSAKSAMVILLGNFHVVKVLTIAGPMVPLILMGLWTLAIGIATIISWQSSNPHVAERADDAVIRFGSCGACCNTIIASMLASTYLFVGIAVGGFCTHLDTNVISLVKVVNFTELTDFPVVIDPVLEGAAKYYILGSQENPMISMIEDVERDAHALYSVYSNATWAVEPAKMVCNGVKNLNASDAMDACHESVNFAGQLIAASNVYPYYRTFAHDLMCDKMLHSMKLLILFTIVVSMILMPLVALCADIDLRKWERYKMDNYEDHYDMSYEGHEGHEGHEKSQLLGVSPSSFGMLPQMPQMPHIPGIPGMGPMGPMQTPSRQMQMRPRGN